MKAYKISIPKGYVEWTSVNSADPMGIYSGYNPDELSNIVINSIVDTGADYATMNGITFGQAVPPVIYQTAATTGNGAPTTIQSQNTTASLSTGGDLTLTTGTGTSSSGTLYLETGGTERVIIKPSGVVTIPSLSNGVVLSDGYGDLSTLSSSTDGYVLTWLNSSHQWQAKPTQSGGFLAAGDLTGTATSQSVAALQGNPLHLSTLGNSQDGYVLTWDGVDGYWQAKSEPTQFVAHTDLFGTSTSQTVVGIQNNPVQSGALGSNQDGYVLTWVNNLNQWVPQPPPAGGGPTFVISSFTGGSTVECGATVTNPTFSATYSATPITAAQISNTDNINSPLALMSPYTSVQVTGSFTHSTVNFSVVFTLSANKGLQSAMATDSINFAARSFGGVGNAGATSATHSGSNANLSTGDTISNQGLHSSDVGQSYGPFNPVVQKIYLLLPHTSTPHVFKDQNGFIFAMNSPTTFSFTNQNAAVISMDLYESTNPLSTSFTITVFS